MAGERRPWPPPDDIEMQRTAACAGSAIKGPSKMGRAEEFWRLPCGVPHFNLVSEGLSRSSCSYGRKAEPSQRSLQPSSTLSHVLIPVVHICVRPAPSTIMDIVITTRGECDELAGIALDLDRSGSPVSQCETSLAMNCAPSAYPPTCCYG